MLWAPDGAAADRAVAVDGDGLATGALEDGARTSLVALLGGASALAGVVCMWTIGIGGAVGGSGGDGGPMATAPPTTVKAMAPAVSLAARGVARSACWPTRVTMRARHRWAQRPRAGATPRPRPASLPSPLRARKRVRNDWRARWRVTSAAPVLHPSSSAMWRLGWPSAQRESAA